MQATISFPSREVAQAFATAWSRYSLKGYSLSPKALDGSAKVTLDGVTTEHATWINETVAKLNAQMIVE